MIPFGGNSSISIGVNIYGINKFSPVANQIKRDLTQVRNEFNKTYQQNLEAARNLYGGAALLGGMVLNNVRKAYVEGTKFMYTITGAAVVAKREGDNLNQVYSQLYDQTMSLSRVGLFKQQDVAETMREIAKAGVEFNQIMPVTKASVYGAAAAMEELQPVAAVLMQTMNTFGIPTSNAMNTMDMLTAAANASQADVIQLGQSLEYAGATLTNLGITLPETLAMLMSLSQVGIKASAAGTAISNTFRYLATGVSDDIKVAVNAQKALKMMGLSPEDFQSLDWKSGNVVSKVMSMIQQGTQGFDTLKKQNVLETLFGVRGTRGAVPIIDALKQYQNFEKTVRSGKGLTESTATDIMNTPYGSIMKLEVARGIKDSSYPIISTNIKTFN